MTYLAYHGAVMNTGGNMAVAVWRTTFWAACIGWAVSINVLCRLGAERVLDAATGQTAAAWVQAIGSIAAILAAAGTMLWQQKLAQRSLAVDRYRDELEKVAALGGLLCIADGMLSAAHNCADSKANTGVYARTYRLSTLPLPETVLEALTGTPNSYATTPELLLHMLEAHKAFRDGLTQMQMMRNDLTHLDKLNFEWIQPTLAEQLTIVHRAYMAFCEREIELRRRIGE